MVAKTGGWSLQWALDSLLPGLLERGKAQVSAVSVVRMHVGGFAGSQGDPG